MDKDVLPCLRIGTTLDTFQEDMCHCVVQASLNNFNKVFVATGPRFLSATYVISTGLAAVLWRHDASALFNSSN